MLTRSVAVAAGDESGDLVRLTEVTRTSLEGWHTFADHHGCTLTALAEVIGLALADITVPLEDLPEPLRTWTAEARLLTATRRREGRRKRQRG